MDVHPLEFWARSSKVPSEFHINLTTTGLEESFPGMEQLYGPDVPVDVKFGLI